jgi:DNA-3-methyladenine glycosylase II
MMPPPTPDERLRPAMEALAAADPDIAAAYADCGLPPVRGSAPGFAGLIRMIAGQQVSVQAAAAIVARLEARVDPLTAGEFLKASEADLRAVGFSRPKMRYGRFLAEEIVSGRLDIDGLETLDDDGGRGGADPGQGHRPLDGGDLPAVRPAAGPTCCRPAILRSASPRSI